MATIEPINNTQQSISDDQELAKVLAGVSQDADAAQEEAPTLPPVPPVADEPASDGPADTDALADEAPALPDPASVVDTTLPTASIGAATDDLGALKQEALTELRPLVDKLDVSPEEKFDTYLLLLRSTDDRALIAPAHEAAKNIADEARRAQALLDIIKEIDFLSGPKQ